MRLGALRAAPALVLAACGPATFKGALDLSRVERGDIYLETVALPGGRYMLRGVAVVNVPPWRVLNLYDDIEGYPLWSRMLTEIREERREAGVIDTRFIPRPTWASAAPVGMRVRLDRDRSEVSFTLLENDFMRDGTWVSKVEPLAGDRTLLTVYASGDAIVWWAKFAVPFTEAAVAETVVGIREAVKLPRYDTARGAASPGLARSKVVVPGFRAEGVPAEMVRTLTRVFAEQLMKSDRFNIITQDEAVALLDYARKQQLAGCSGEAACTLDIGRALEAERIVHGSIGRVGETWVLSAALLKLPDGSVERRVTGEAGDERVLLERVRAAAGEMARP